MAKMRARQDALAWAKARDKARDKANSQLRHLSRALSDAALAARRPRKFDLMDAHIVEVDPGGW